MWIYTPRRVENLAHFNAADPWNGNQQTPFDLDRVFIRSIVPDRTNLEDESKPHKYAIRSALEQHHRTLPDSLVSLWRDGRIPVERLPPLLKGLEPNLKRSDYIKLLSMTRLQRIIRRFAPSSIGLIFALVGLAVTLDDAGTGIVMMIIGALILVACEAITRQLHARRKEQMEWAMGQPSASRGAGR